MVESAFMRILTGYKGDKKNRSFEFKIGRSPYLLRLVCHEHEHAEHVDGFVPVGTALYLLCHLVFDGINSSLSSILDIKLSEYA